MQTNIHYVAGLFISWSGGTIISRADYFQASFTIGNNYSYAKISGNSPCRMDIITKDLLAVMISVLFTDKTQSGNEHEYQDDSF